MPASSRRQFLKEAKLLLLLRDLAGLLRSLLHCALRLLRLLRFLGHVALLMLSEMALVAACTRESRCTTSRIHQHIQKNSFPLKEVLTTECESARCTDVSDFTTRSRLDEKIAATTCVGVRKNCMNRFYCSAFLIHEQDERNTISLVATRQCRKNGPCTDSESRGLATKKFSSSQRWSLAGALRSELFRTNRDHRFGRALAIATTSFGSR